ncbi:hypothetical protein ACS0TY_027558 [Phlomoides rotata]
MVDMYRGVLSHHSKVRVVKFSFKRSGQTIHTYFHVLQDVLKLHEVLLVKPSPMTDDSTHPSWKHFKEWTSWRDTLAHEMYNSWRGSGNAEHVSKLLRNRNDKGSRGWSVREEQVLSEAMKKIVLEGWKTENGFKIGYLNLLSTYMKQIDPNARLMRSKSWPLYDDLCEIFGNSKATVGDETQDESQSPSGYAQTGESTDMGKTNSGRKRKTPLHPDPMVSVVQNLCDNALNRLGDITQRIGHDQDLSAARKMIYSSISKMSILTLHEKLRATSLIARNAEDIDVFFSLPDSDRVEWVKMLLNGKI